VNILVVAAMLKEYHCAREALSAVELTEFKGYRCSKKSIKKSNIFILQSGYNSRPAMEEVINKTGSMNLIIDSGSCGLLKGDFSQGDIVKSLCLSSLGGESCLIPSTPWDEYFKSVPLVSCLQVSEPVQSRENKELFQEKGDICSMETLDVYQFSKERKSDFLSIRVITDNADENSMKDFKKNLRPFSLTLYYYLKDFLINISH